MWTEFLEVSGESLNPCSTFSGLGFNRSDSAQNIPDASTWYTLFSVAGERVGTSSVNELPGHFDTRNVAPMAGDQEHSAKQTFNSPSCSEMLNCSSIRWRKSDRLAISKSYHPHI
jgi:hypothetical protein